VIFVLLFVYVFCVGIMLWRLPPPTFMHRFYPELWEPSNHPEVCRISITSA